MRLLVSAFAISLLSLSASAQAPSTDVAVLVRQAMSRNVLTTPDAAPFHAVLQITPNPKGSADQHGSIELFWAAPDRYVLNMDSPEFTDHLIVQDGRSSDIHRGDYYPIWLRFLVQALFNPVDRAAEILSHPNAAKDQPWFQDICYEWDSRHNVVTDAEREAKICFHKDPLELSFTLDSARFISLSNFQPFHGKSIARTYEAGLRVRQDPIAKLTLLENWKPDPATFKNDAADTTHPIDFQQLTRLDAETRIASQPQNINWPTTKEGATSGNILVNVVTDRMGKVREAAATESDNEQLKTFAADVAKQYTFKPLLVNGEAVQMQIPLILHFNTTIANALPVMDDTWLRANAKHCHLPTTLDLPGKSGTKITITIRISANGKLLESHGVMTHDLAMQIYQTIPSCKLPPVLQNGQPTDFDAQLILTAR